MKVFLLILILIILKILHKISCRCRKAENARRQASADLLYIDCDTTYDTDHNTIVFASLGVC